MFLRLHRFLMTRRSQAVKKSAEHRKGIRVEVELLEGVRVGRVKTTATLISEEDPGGTAQELLRLQVLNGPTDTQYKGGYAAVKTLING